MGWKFWRKAKPEIDPEETFKAYLMNAAIFLERNREDFIKSEAKRTSFAVVFMADWGFLHKDIQDTLDEFAQIQIQRGLDEHYERRAERIKQRISGLFAGADDGRFGPDLAADGRQPDQSPEPEADRADGAEGSGDATAA